MIQGGLPGVLEVDGDSNVNVGKINGQACAEVQGRFVQGVNPDEVESNIQPLGEVLCMLQPPEKKWRVCRLNEPVVKNVEKNRGNAPLMLVNGLRWGEAIGFNNRILQNRCKEFIGWNPDDDGDLEDYFLSFLNDGKFRNDPRDLVSIFFENDYRLDVKALDKSKGIYRLRGTDIEDGIVFKPCMLVVTSPKNNIRNEVTAQKPLADSMQTHLQPSKTVTKKAENEGLPVENEQLRNEWVIKTKLLSEGEKNGLLIAGHKNIQTVSAMLLYHSEHKTLRVLKGQGDTAAIAGCSQSYMECAGKAPNDLLYSMEETIDSSVILFILNEYLPGQPLKAFLKDNQPDLPEIVHIFEGLVDGIEHIARHNIIHNDCSLANIIYAGGNRSVKIIDWGISKKVKISSDQAYIHTYPSEPETPLFSTPENMIFGKKYLEKTDLYMCAVVLMLMLTGKAPAHYREESAEDCLVRSFYRQTDEMTSARITEWWWVSRFYLFCEGDPKAACSFLQENIKGYLKKKNDPNTLKAIVEMILGIFKTKIEGRWGAVKIKSYMAKELAGILPQ